MTKSQLMKSVVLFSIVALVGAGRISFAADTSNSGKKEESKKEESKVEKVIDKVKEQVKDRLEQRQGQPGGPARG